MKHFAFQLAVYIMANIALAVSVTGTWAFWSALVVMVMVPSLGLAWEIARWRRGVAP